MQIKKGQLLKIRHSRKGTFTGVAINDFTYDPNIDSFYPIAVAQLNIVNGMNNSWGLVEEIPCRSTLCTIELLPDDHLLAEGRG